MLATTHKGVEGYDVKKELVRPDPCTSSLLYSRTCADHQRQQSIIVATVEHERFIATEAKVTFAQIFKGVNFWRLFIAFWPKAMQQLAGQSVTNNYGTYFCECGLA